jgi:hypothetical protein
MLDWLAQRVRILMLRTEPTPLRGLWRLLYEAAIRASAAYLRQGRPQIAIYVRRSFGSGEPVAGLSDIDLTLVVPEDPRGPGIARAELRRRWGRARKRLGLLGKAIDLGVYEQADLERVLAAAPAHLRRRRAAASSGRGLPPLYFGPRRPRDYYGLTIRPGLYGPTTDWRLVAGPERLPAGHRRGPGYRSLASWLELQYWWRQAYDVCASPERVDAAYLCFKIVAESARTWLWLAREERVARPRDALERMAALVPEERATLEAFLELRRVVTSSPPPPLHETLEMLHRTSARIAGLLAERARPAGHRPVRVLGPETWDDALDGPSRHANVLAVRPLCDWRGLVFPTQPDQLLAFSGGDPRDPHHVAAAAASAGGRVQPAFASGDIVLLPAQGATRSWFRAIQCAASDPVSFALLAGSENARFPELPGWSASDAAERAVAEHGGWLNSERFRADWRSVASLFSAARAALFWEALQEQQPLLPLTTEATAALLAEVRPGARAAVVDGAAGCREARSGGRPPSPRLVGALRRHVARLPAYSAAPARQSSSRSNFAAIRAQS